MEEIYKDIPNYEGLYQVSNLGNVKSLGKISIAGRSLKEKELKTYCNSKGYSCINLVKDSKRRFFTVHQLIAIAFLGHSTEDRSIVIDHIDNNPKNNNIVNLQIVPNRINTSKDKKNVTSAYTGVSWYKQTKKWRSGIEVEGKKIKRNIKINLVVSNIFRMFAV